MKKFLSGILILLAGLAVSQGLTPIQRLYVQQRTKVVSRDTATVPGHVVNTFRRGNETWSTTNKLAAVGVPSSRRISKLNLIITLKGINKWEPAKTFIVQSGYYDEWLACQFIDDHYPLFIQATNAAVQAGIATDAEIKKVVEASYDD